MLGTALAISLTLADAACALTPKTANTVVDGSGNRVKTRSDLSDGVQHCRTTLVPVDTGRLSIDKMRKQQVCLR